MSKSQVTILNFNALYNILFEIKDTLKFEIYNCDDEVKLNKEQNDNNIIIITNTKNFKENNDYKNVIFLNDLPIKFIDLIDIININLLKQKYSFQSNFNIKKYKLDMNSRIISHERKSLKLTEKEVEIILFLHSKDNPQKIDILQKEVWGYSENLETHTVETHVYRLRKKINEVFNDENFLISTKDGYNI